MEPINVIGGGLAGSEAAWQIALRGLEVRLFEMRPITTTPAHVTANLAELVCSNSFGANTPDRASGLLKEELRLLGSLLVELAEKHALPAGSSLAVDRNCFSGEVTEKILNHPRIDIIRREVTQIPDGVTVIATGPLSSPAIAKQIETLSEKNNLFFYDAIAPVVTYESIDMSIAFRAARYSRGVTEEGDYINCPLTKEQYELFVTELIGAERFPLRQFEKQIDEGVDAGAGTFFEGCLPVEVLATRGINSLAFGPMRPVGLINPHTGKRPYAVIQLRQDNIAGTLYNMVGFQTNITQAEQKRVFQKIPGLENAQFVRYGQMHRNTFIASPLLLDASFEFRTQKGLFFAGQITGIEGYMGNVASGLIAGVNATRFVSGEPLLTFPQTTMAGSLCHYITHVPVAEFQPMKANFGILPPIEPHIKNKKLRYQMYAKRSINDLQSFIDENRFFLL